jgi:hypothetical protein
MEDKSCESLRNRKMTAVTCKTSQHSQQSMIKVVGVIQNEMHLNRRKTMTFYILVYHDCYVTVSDVLYCIQLSWA